MKRIHFATADFMFLLCGCVSVNATRNESEVTCPRCLAILRKS